MSLENSTRVFLVLFGFWAALFGAWWLPFVPMVLLSMRFRSWEVLALGLFIDFFWLPAGWHWPFFLVSAICISWVFEPFRKELLLS